MNQWVVTEMRIYVAGPMRGLPNFNSSSFHEAAAKLRAQGHFVFDPAAHDEEVFGKIRSPKGSEVGLARKAGMTTMELRREVFATDTRWICEKAEAIYMLPGWQNSKGATAERALGIALGLQILNEDNDPHMESST